MRYALAALAMAAATVAAPAHAAWREASTNHFLVYSEDSEKELREFATRLERFDRAMRVHSGLADPAISPGNRLTVFVVANVNAVQKLYGKGGGNVGGFYMGRATGSVAITPRIGFGEGQTDLSEQIVLLHEYAHHFMLQNYPGAFPAWLVEGYAEFHSTAVFEKDGTVVIGPPANHRAHSFAMTPMKIEKLLTASVGELKGAEREALYSRGWLLTHYLMLEPSRKGQLSAYVAAVNKGTDSLQAARAAFGDLAQLDKEIGKYLLQPRISVYRVKPQNTDPGRIDIRELAPGEAAVMDVRIRSKRGVDRDAALALLPLARKAAAPYPGVVLAQIALAEAEFDAGNYAQAEAAADRALAADPKSVDAMIYKGRAKMAIARAANSSDPAAWREVRHWFLAANKIDSDDAEPLMLFYSSFLAEGRQPTANAALGLERALELAPQDQGLHWMMAYQFLRDGKGAEARGALAPVAFNPHGGQSAVAAAAILARLEAGGVKAALDIWDSAQPVGDGAS